MSQESEGRKAVGWILAIIGLVQLIIFLLLKIYFLLALPILFLIIGAALIDGPRAVGWILVIIGPIQFIVFLLIEFYFLLFIPIIILIIGVVLIVSSLNEDMESDTVQPDLSLSNTETKTNDGPISHDSEEYRRWKEGK